MYTEVDLPIERKSRAHDFVAIKFTTPDSHTEDIKTIAMEKDGTDGTPKTELVFGFPQKGISFDERKLRIWAFPLFSLLS